MGTIGEEVQEVLKEVTLMMRIRIIWDGLSGFVFAIRLRSEDKLEQSLFTYSHTPTFIIADYKYPSSQW